eukprot:12898069-Prorocentrum_lima.AAC.1
MSKYPIGDVHHDLHREPPLNLQLCSCQLQEQLQWISLRDVSSSRNMGTLDPPAVANHPMTASARICC